LTKQNVDEVPLGRMEVDKMASWRNGIAPDLEYNDELVMEYNFDHLLFRCHATQHNDTPHKRLIYDTQHTRPSA
jgi:hypothetical protein